MRPPLFYGPVKVDALPIFYREAGPKDAPAILLLHRLPSSSRMYEPRKQRLIHSRGRWQSVKQENRGGIFRPRLSIEDGECIHLYWAVKKRRAHRSFT